MTSSSIRVSPPPVRRVQIKVRELGPHDGSSPSVRSVAFPPSAGTTQMWKPPICEVNAISFPSGDQSGSVGLSTPTVRITCAVPPETETFCNARRSLSFAAKQIQRPSGDQQGDDSSWGDFVNRRRSLPSELQTYKSVQPSLLRIMATLEPSGDGAGLMFDPP